MSFKLTERIERCSDIVPQSDISATTKFTGCIINRTVFPSGRLKMQELKMQDLENDGHGHFKADMVCIYALNP